MTQSDEEKIQSLHPSIQSKVRSLFEKAEEHGLPIKIQEGLRSFERQGQLYAQGRTKSGAIVTNAQPGYSWHNYGLAADIIHSQLGYSAPKDFWPQMGELAESVGLEWGGRWTSFPDRPHVQYTGGLSYAQALRGDRPTNKLTEEEMTQEERQLLSDLKNRVFTDHENSISVLSKAKLDERITNVENLEGNSKIVKVILKLKRLKFGKSALQEWWDKKFNKVNS